MKKIRKLAENKEFDAGTYIVEDTKLQHEIKNVIHQLGYETDFPKSIGVDIDKEFIRLSVHRFK